MPNTGDIVRASDFQAIKPQLSIGTVTTGAAGSNASASITGTSPNFKLNLTIPRGANGANGTNGTSGIMFSQVFTSSTTVTVPTGATKAVLSGCGGGGGGYINRGGVLKFGCSGECILNYVASVTSGTSIKITIGAAGRGGNSPTSGGITSFGSLLSLSGGVSGNFSTYERNKMVYNAFYCSGIDNIGRDGESNIFGLGGDVTISGSGTSIYTDATGYGTGGTYSRDGRPGILIVIWSR